MKIEDQVCSLEQAKKLKELGVDLSKATFMYVGESETECEDGPVFTGGYDWGEYPAYSEYPFQYPAFTFTELSYMLGFVPDYQKYSTEDLISHSANELIRRLEDGRMLVQEVNARLSA